MFTGIVEEIGVISGIKQGKNSEILTIKAKKVLEDTKIGDSIAVNGICLTVTALYSDSFTADVMHETINRSSLSKLKYGSKVNLERAMPVNGRFGGHIVSGHVDGTGTIINIKPDDNAIWYKIQANQQILRYIVQKGSITIDGISLTVAKVSETDFSISAIPHTVEQTILKEKRQGDIVNLETDILAKYIEKLLPPNKQSKITREFLIEHGF